MKENKVKGKKLGKFVLWTCVTMIISFLIAGTVIGNNSEYFKNIFESEASFYKEISKNSTSIDDEYVNGIAGIDKIIIDSVSSDVNVIKTDGDQIKAHFHGRAQKLLPELRVREEGGKLYIEIYRQKSHVFWLGSIFEQTNLDVYIPGTFGKDLEIEVVSSDISIPDLEVSNLKLESVSGNIDIISAVFGELSANSVSGRITLDTSMLKGDVDIETTSGNVIIELPFDVQGFSFDYSTVSGSFENRINGLKISDHTGKKYKGTFGDEKYSIRVETVSGDLLLH
jgi:lia operon protein LiaG